MRYETNRYTTAQRLVAAARASHTDISREVC